MVSDAFLLVIACTITVGLVLTISNTMPSDITKIFESFPKFLSFEGTEGSSESGKTESTKLIILPRDDCIVYEGTQLRYIKSAWQCSGYFKEVADDENWCFDGMFDAIAADMFNQSSYKSYATIAKYVYC